MQDGETSQYASRPLGSTSREREVPRVVAICFEEEEEEEKTIDISVDESHILSLFVF